MQASPLWDWVLDLLLGDSSLEQTTSDRYRGVRVDTSPPVFVLRAVAHVPFSSYDSRWTSSSPHELSRDTHVHPAPSAVTPAWQERERE
jgi:hypothetical protein